VLVIYMLGLIFFRLRCWSYISLLFIWTAPNIYIYIYVHLPCVASLALIK
jgi:hypothetical protein